MGLLLPTESALKNSPKPNPQLMLAPELLTAFYLQHLSGDVYFL